jgi:hypothetical protein
MRHYGDLSLIENLYRLSLLCPSILLLPRWLLQPKVKPRPKKSNGIWARSPPWKPKRIRRRTSTARIQVQTRIRTRKDPLMPKVLNPTNRVHLLLLLLRSVRYPAHTQKLDASTFYPLFGFWLFDLHLHDQSLRCICIGSCMSSCVSSSTAFNDLISTRFFPYSYRRAKRLLLNQRYRPRHPSCRAPQLHRVNHPVTKSGSKWTTQLTQKVCSDFILFYFPTFCWAIVRCCMSQCLWLIGVYCD